MDRIINSVKISIWIRLIPLLFGLLFLILSFVENNDIILINISLMCFVIGLFTTFFPTKYIKRQNDSYAFFLYFIRRIVIQEKWIEYFVIRNEISIENGISRETRIEIKLKKGCLYLSSRLVSSLISNQEMHSDGSLKSFIYSVSFGVIEYKK